MPKKKGNLELIDTYPVEIGGRKFDVKKLDTTHAMKCGAMIGKLLGDNRISNALASGENSLIITAVISVGLSETPRDIALLCADVLGIADKYDLEEVRKEVRKEAREDGLIANTEYVRQRWEDDILDEFGKLPPATVMRVLNEVMQQDRFDDFLQESRSFGETVSMIGSRFSSLSNSNGDSQTES